MPNAPAKTTVTASFTMPEGLMKAVTRVAKRQMTNKSEVIRRALMEYLPEDEQKKVMAEILDAENEEPGLAGAMAAEAPPEDSGAKSKRKG